MRSRRDFLMAGAAASAFSVARVWAAKTNGTPFPYEEFEARIARRDFRDITKDVLPTPSMMVDLDLFQRNVKQMAEQARSAGIHVRPHVKVHKSVDVARRQIAQGAIGLTCATIAEAELFSGAGIKNVLWTKQPASVNNIQRAVALSKKDPTFMFVVDDPQVVDWVEQAAIARSARLRIAVSVLAGMDRQGIENGRPAVELAQKVASSKRAQFEGFMAYSGNAAHTKTFEARRKRSSDDLAGARETVSLARQSGLPVNIVSGGSTGTYNMDHEHGLTELEAGSYVFMDTAYFAIGGKDDEKVYNDFKGALTVLTTVDSKRHPNLVTTDYGNKAITRPTDQVKGMPWLQVGTQGAEYGALRWSDADKDVKLGDRVEIYCTNLDMSTNAFDRYYVAQGDQIVDVWPIMGRSGAAQR
ncbi:putative 3-hydroxy-D-aspartate aldolase [Candidatus Sulfopaludibacter sp. SbA6]|nr:putative 3-hydroxy-D-aspartate aldolase [Candidatus Sulfopaludibacter sp. SbA6]